MILTVPPNLEVLGTPYPAYAERLALVPVWHWTFHLL